MPLDVHAAKVLEMIRLSGRPPYETLAPAEARQFSRNARAVLAPEPPEMGAVRDIKIGEGGAIPARLYRPLGSAPNAALPALIYFHGGGWVIGDLDTHDVVCRQIANGSGGAVVSVDYRLAPEHKFPAAVEDAIAATAWIAAHGATLGIDTARLAVGGDSAGGNLAAVVALDARDRNGPKLIQQTLIYPATESTMSHPSHERFAEGLLLTRPTMKWFLGHYLRGAEDLADWRVSPLRATSLANLPPALVLTAGYDPLCDEGEDYAARLAAAGVPVTRVRVEGMIHGFLTMGKLIPAANEAVAMIAAALKIAFAR
ncbi:MAG: alpha/beta hydrolase [Acidibrevibacterium sp.]|jgi:acetyl esterase|uniref:alpha/beta hydrolase n=1 Tax=Acidibrevibacterium fodinaquatile TaxID=1969806 RepID=UPI0023A8DAD2|nr:alpha/beta hydrolase [Acidibrevibacterium fodinaquatile]MCA7119460.1 alpha/beta hydrolase [Acidibrevibacterium fodinaquatile]